MAGTSPAMTVWEHSANSANFSIRALAGAVDAVEEVVDHVVNAELKL